MGDNPEKKTDIHARGGVFRAGDVLGHGNAEGRIRKRDGLIFRGEEIGSVDESNQIRRKDGFFFRGEVVGQVKDGLKAHAKDGIIFSGEEWGYVDAEGNIRQKDGFLFRGKIIGQARGNNPQAALGFFVLRFREIVDKVDGLEQEMKQERSKARFLGRVQSMLQWVPEADALGDFDGLLRRLRGLEKIILDELNENLQRKKALCERAERISESSDWKSAADTIKALQSEWKTVGPVPKDKVDDLWEQFRKAVDRFFSRREAHFKERDRKQAENLHKKEHLCAKAEALSSSSEWKNSGETMKELQRQWSAVGPVPREQADPLWNRFRGAMDRFYARRQAHFEKTQKEHEENLRRKERLCEKAEALSSATDWKAAGDSLKSLQAEWKAVGPVPRERADALWNRFRSALDRFYERRSAYFEQRDRERERKQAEWQGRMREVLEHKRDQACRLRDSIQHDEEAISRWQSAIYNLRPGGRADEIRASLEDKISSVESKVASKESRLRDLEASIIEIRGKL